MDILENEKFDMYCKILIEWNEKINLTAITEPEEIKTKHFRDSVLPIDEIPENASLLDIGSGAGFPGIPLKIVRPDLKITLLDSLQKRIKFLDYAISALHLVNITCVHSRIEDFKPKESFDVVTARAVAPLATLSEYALPFVKLGGKFIAYKSSNVNDELNAARKIISLCGGDNIEVKTAFLDETTVRSFVIVEKTKHCPPSYPRGGNKPRLSPILG